MHLKVCVLLPLLLAINVCKAELALEETAQDENLKFRSEPNLSDTEDFILKNLNGAKKVSCEEISTEFYTDDKLSQKKERYGVNFAPAQVDYDIYVKGGRTIIAECISEKCVRYNNITEGNESREFQEGVLLRSVIDGARLVKALLHHQEICGGKIKPVF